MSSINGDKAKHHVLRKMKIQRRLRNHALYLTLQSDPTATQASVAAKKKISDSTPTGNDGSNV
jgi:hypothetical protein